MNDTATTTTWDLLEQALRQRRPVWACYHGQDRLLCPHALGWKNGRAKVLAYQADGTTTAGPLPTGTTQRWRSLFIDQIKDLRITDETWETADNYSYSRSNCIDQLALAILQIDLK
jgi:WYL domain